MTVTEGASIALKCDIGDTFNVNIVKYGWERQKLKNGSAIESMMKGPSLKILRDSSVRVSISANYRCWISFRIATRFNEKMTSDFMTLKVTRKLDFKLRKLVTVHF